MGFSDQTADLVLDGVFSIVKMVFGLDLEAASGRKREVFVAAGEALGQMKELMDCVAAALEPDADGIVRVQWSEVAQIIDEADDIEGAISAVGDLL